MISKEAIKEGEIIDIKNFLTPEQATMLWNRANDDNYSFGHNSDSKSSQRQGRWVQRFHDDFTQSDLWVDLAKAIDSPITFREAYINYADYSTPTLPHCDNIPNGGTVLICINQEWRRQWAGFTVFFKDMSSPEIIKTVCPEPGKAVIFNGGIWHYALPPRDFSDYPRFMLAIKFDFMEIDKPNEKTKEN